MDVSELISGFRTLHVDTVESALQSKLKAFELAHKISARKEEPFEDFLRGVPVGLLSGFISNESVDGYFNTLLSSALNGHEGADTFLAAVLHATVMQLTYQGRHRPFPEAYVLGRGGAPEIGELGLLNSSGVPAFRLDEAAPLELDENRSSLALNVAKFRHATAAQVPEILGSTMQRIGCAAFLGIGASVATDRAMVLDLRDLAGAATPETFYLLAGEAESLAKLRQRVTDQHPNARVLTRFYWHGDGAASQFLGVLIITGLHSALELGEWLEGRQVQYRIRSLADISKDAGRTDIKEVLVKAGDKVLLRPPVVVSSSAALPEEQASKISDPLEVTHVVLSAKGGRVIRSRDGLHSTYVIVSGAGEIVQDYQEPGGFEASPYAPQPDRPDVSSPCERRLTKEVRGACLLLTFHPIVHSFHSHFLLQCFPRIQLMRHMGVTDYSILVPHDIKGYQVEMLAIAGVDRDRLVRMDPDFDYVAEELLVPKLFPAVFTPLYAEVYAEMIAKVCPEPITPTRRIIISREARTTWRNMLNFDMIAQVLIEQHGFELVWPDKLSIEDEIRLFREAKIVVGAEGAGLYNCCFMSPGSHVVCLADQDYVMYIVGSMAHIRGFDVSYVFGESFMADSDRSRRSGHANFIVDPMRVSATVSEIIAAG